MNAQLIGQVFASLQYLEKCLGSIKKLSCGQEERCSSILQALPAQERVLAQMRRAANLLQLETARNDLHGAIRSLKIFYGLNHMVRDDITSALGKITQQHAAHMPKNVQWGKPLLFH